MALLGIPLFVMASDCKPGWGVLQKIEKPNSCFNDSEHSFVAVRAEASRRRLAILADTM